MVTIMCLMVVVTGLLMFKPYQGYKIKDIPEEVKLPPMAVKFSGPLPVDLGLLPASDKGLSIRAIMKFLAPSLKDVEACALRYVVSHMGKGRTPAPVVFV